MAVATPPPIIIIKKRKAHHAHHGGAWKVAYADFVTAMMALFIVLWLLSSSDKVKKAVGGYFMDPTGSGKMTGSNMAGEGESLSVREQDLKNLKDRMEQAVKSVPELKAFQDQVKITMTGEGLRIELLETAEGAFFPSGQPKPNPTCIVLLQKLSEELGKMPNSIILEGHTDAKPYGGDGTYSNWNLSSERATQALFVMLSSGLRAKQIVQVRGFADHNLFKPEDPLHPSNRRISVIIQYKNEKGAKTGEVAAAPEAAPMSSAVTAHH